MNPYQNNSRSKKMLTVIGVYIGVITAITISMGNSVLLPMAAKEIGGLDIYALAATLGGVISVGAMPLFGYLSARAPHIRRMGFVLAFLGGTLCLFLRAIAPNMWFIVLPAVFLGIESAALYTFGYSIIRDCFDQKQSGIYLGLIGTFIAAGTLVGPVLTGAITEFAGWRAVPAAQLVLFLVAAILVFFGARVTKEEGRSIAYVSGKFDLFGAIALILLLGSLILALSLGNIAPIGSTTSNIFFAIAAVALISVIWTVAKKKETAIIPNIAFKSRNTLVLTAANFLSPFDSMSTNFFLPLFIIYILKQGPTVSSLAITLYAVLGLFISPIFGRWIARIGTAKPVIVWFSGAWRVVITLALIFYLKPGANIFVIYALMLLAGLYSTAGGVIASAGPQIMIRPEIRQQANALVQLGQNFGGTLGIAVYSAIITAFGMERGMTYGLTVACAGAVALMISGLFMTKPDWNQESEAKNEAKNEAK